MAEYFIIRFLMASSLYIGVNGISVKPTTIPVGYIHNDDIVLNR